MLTNRQWYVLSEAATEHLTHSYYTCSSIVRGAHKAKISTNKINIISEKYIEFCHSVEWSNRLNTAVFWNNAKPHKALRLRAIEAFTEKHVFAYLCDLTL